MKTETERTLTIQLTEEEARRLLDFIKKHLQLTGGMIPVVAGVLNSRLRAFLGLQ